MTVAELFQSIRRKKQAVAVDTFRPYRSLLVDIASGKTVDPDHAESVIDAASKNGMVPDLFFDTAYSRANMLFGASVCKRDETA